MLYTYTVYSESNVGEKPIRCEITTRVEEIKPTDVCHPRYVEVYHNGTNNIIKDLRSLDDLEGWIVGLERAFAWKPEKKEEIIFKKEINEAENPEEKWKEKEAEYANKFADPYRAARRGFVDEVIHPKNTRRKLIKAFQMLEGKEVIRPNRKHGNIPL